ncbi:MAG: UDP-N-acetylmuramoyl-L-alanyl-D-glutamate--2,6-diaminopimelate ligase, partial [Nitrospiraceae bacterium]|nr:UDP-N-acetylmuramoyl-L-alanyl-D-glutamate--2,6-diaminopimelate ligase [Nitrospiraceae bacterium]
GLRFEIAFKGKKFPVSSRLIGAHNVYNLLAAFGALVGLGISPEDAIDGLESLEGVKGRFERVECGQDFLVVVDYAHTPDALQRLIQAARAVSGGRVITMFGCGGDRDKGKRREMGLIGAALSDIAVITSDNPRSEDPVSIINDIKEGIPADRAADCMLITDRAQAIAKAIELARPGDAVLIAGKGHEDYQEINGARMPFSDCQAAIDALKDQKTRSQKRQNR